MRDNFDNLHGLLQTYQFYKFAVDGIPAIMPKPVQLPQRVDKNRESMLLFVADVERYVIFYYEQYERPRIVPIPPNCLLDIFQFRCCPHVTRFTSWRHLARRFKIRLSNGERLPRRLLYASNLHVVGQQLERRATDYFATKGYIT